MSGFKVIGKVLAALLKVSGKGLFQIFYILRKKKLYIPVHFLFAVIPQILGAYHYLQAQGLEWYYALFGAIGAETGGAAITIYKTLFKMATTEMTTLGYIILLIGALSSIVTLMLIFDIWTLFLRAFSTNIGFIPIFITISIFLAATFTNTLFIDEYVLEDGETRISGMTYFIENPREALEPIIGAAKNNEDFAEKYNSTKNSTNSTITDLLIDQIPINETSSVG